MTLDRSRLKAYFRALEDKRPLDPAKPADSLLYVPGLHRDEANSGAPGADPVASLALQISVDAGSSVYLFTGGIGTGKSTELRRLRNEIRKNDPETMVVLADMSDYLHMESTIDIGSLLITAAAALTESIANELARVYGIPQIGVLTPDSYWKRVASFLTSEVGIKEINGAGLKLDLKSTPDFKDRIREKLESSVGALRDLIEQFIGELLDDVEKSISKRPAVVLILDSLERLRGVGAKDDVILQSVKELFTRYPDKLLIPGIKVVYSVAPYLLKLAPDIKKTLGVGAVEPLTAGHVFKHRSREVDLDGIQVFVEILTRRCPDWELFLTRPRLEEMIWKTAGDLREFFRVLKMYFLEVHSGAEPAATKDYALAHVRKDLMPMLSEDRVLLKRFNGIFEADISENDLPRFIDALDRRRLIMYDNGDEWYQLHPLLWT